MLKNLWLRYRDKTKTEKILLACMALLLLVYLIINLIIKPIVDNDMMNGMLSLHNYLNGSHWNKALALSADFKHVTENELTWWAPGQYELPYLLSKILFINIGLAITILIFAVACGGCWFYYKLFKLSSLNNNSIVFTALLVLFLQRFINIFFVEFYSSDIILFFYTPFYVFAYYNLLKDYQKKTILKLVLLTLLNIGGVFIKNSFILFEIAANGFLVVEYFFNNRLGVKEGWSGKTNIGILRKLSIPLPFVIANALNYWFFLRLGYNPSSGKGLLFSLSNILTGLFTPVIQTLFSSLSSYSFYSNLYKITIPQATADIAMVMVLLVIGFIIYKMRDRILDLFKTDVIFRFVLVAAIINTGIWFVFILKQSYILPDDRLYLPICILLLPYLLNIAVTSRSFWKCIYFAMIVCSVIYGVASYANRIKNYALKGTVWSQDEKLTGFKVFKFTKGDDADIAAISNVLQTRYPNDYVLMTGASVIFELHANNKFIVPTVLPKAFPANLKPANDYVVLVQSQWDKTPTGLKKVFESGRYALYKAE